MASGKEPEGQGRSWRVQLGRVTLGGGEREAVEGPQPRSSVPPGCLPLPLLPLPRPLWVCWLRGLLKTSPEPRPFGGHSESMLYVCALHSLQELPPHLSSPDVLVTIFRSWSSQSLPTWENHQPQPTRERRSYFWLSEWTAREMLGLLPLGRTLLDHSFRDTVLTGLSCTGSLPGGAHASCRTACKRI